jgi:hypothetical protein
VRGFHIEDNVLEDVGSSAIAIVDESCGRIKGNILRNVRGNALYISGYSDVKIEENTIELDQYPGIAVLLGSTAIVQENSIRGVECSGACVRGARKVDIRGLSVSEARECGISIYDTVSCAITDSTFENCQLAAVECYNRSVVSVTGVTVRHCPIGFQVYTDGQLRAEDNVAVGVATVLARLAFGGSARVVGTQCTDVAAQADFRTTGTCVFRENGVFNDWTNDAAEAGALGIELQASWAEEASAVCLKCKVNARSAFLMECGHRAYCLECATEAKAAKELCPICRFPIVNATLGFEANLEDVCVICSENPPTCMAIPCGHRGFCRRCMEQWYKSHKFCPACRTEPSSFKEIVWNL